MRGAKARAVYDPASDVVSLSISPYPGSVFTWPQAELAIVDAGTESAAGARLSLTEDVVRALYEELGRYFGGDVVDARRLRADYDAERGRVDKFIDAMIRREGGGVSEFAEGGRITVRLQTADPDNPEAVACREVSGERPGWPTPGDDEARTVEEWRVTGDPGHGYPPYRLTFRSDRYETPDEAARRFRELGQDWADGPHLAHRTITYTAWENC